MPVSITSVEATPYDKMNLAMQFAEGLKGIIDDFPNVTLVMDISEVLIGYRFRYPVAGRKTRLDAHFYAPYLCHKETGSKSRAMQETGRRLLPILSRIALHAEAIREGFIPANDIEVPAIFRALLDREGLSADRFMALIQNKTTSWNDGVKDNAGRKVKPLPLSLRTAGEFVRNGINMIGLEDNHGTQIQYIHEGATPTYSFEGIIPDSIAGPLIGQPITKMVEAPDLEPFAEYLIIKKFEYPTYGSNRVILGGSGTTTLGDDASRMESISAAMKERIETWLGEKLKEDQD